VTEVFNEAEMPPLRDRWGRPMGHKMPKYDVEDLFIRARSSLVALGMLIEEGEKRLKSPSANKWKEALYHLYLLVREDIEAADRLLHPHAFGGEERK
jgi:hypothetical protein